MSLITRCPSCATKFKVTPEQLRVSEGWVRCGRCNNVFDATDHLVEGHFSLTDPQPEEKTVAAATPSADGTAPAATSNGDPARPSERWLKDLSATFTPSTAAAATATAVAETEPAHDDSSPSTPTDAPAADAADTAPVSDSSVTLPLSPEPAAQTTPAPVDQPTGVDTAAAVETNTPTPEGAELPASFADVLASDSPTEASTPAHDEAMAITVAQADTTEDEAAPPVADTANPEHADGADDDIDSFQGELERWQSKQAAANSDLLSTSEDQTAGDSLSAFPAPDSLVSALKKPSTDHRYAEAEASSVTPADTAGPVDAPQPLAPPANKPTSAAYSPVPDMEEGLNSATAEARREAYNAEFSETQELVFMRKAEKRAFWRRPIIRFLMSVLTLLLLAVLAAQYAYHQRDAIAALSPQWKERMQTACQQIGCTIAPFQAIESLVLEGSTFQDEGNNRYTLSWTVRNRNDKWVETPALALSLRNDKGDTVVRRIIQVADIADTPAELAPGAAWQSRQGVRLDGVANAVTGYQLQIFYPSAP